MENVIKVSEFVKEWERQLAREKFKDLDIQRELGNMWEYLYEERINAMEYPNESYDDWKKRLRR